MTPITDLPVAARPILSGTEAEPGDSSNEPTEPKHFLKDYEDAAWVRLEVELDSVLFARR